MGYDIIVRKPIALNGGEKGDQLWKSIAQLPHLLPRPSCIPFYNETGVCRQPTHSNIVAYLGPNLEEFVRAFSKFGPVLKRFNRQ